MVKRFLVLLCCMLFVFACSSGKAQNQHVSMSTRHLGRVTLNANPLVRGSFLDVPSWSMTSTKEGLLFGAYENTFAPESSLVTDNFRVASLFSQNGRAIQDSQVKVEPDNPLWQTFQVVNKNGSLLLISREFDDFSVYSFSNQHRRLRLIKKFDVAPVSWANDLSRFRFAAMVIKGTIWICVADTLEAGPLNESTSTQDRVRIHWAVLKGRRLYRVASCTLPATYSTGNLSSVVIDNKTIVTTFGNRVLYLDMKSRRVIKRTQATNGIEYLTAANGLPGQVLFVATNKMTKRSWVQTYNTRTYGLVASKELSSVRDFLLDNVTLLRTGNGSYLLAYVPYKVRKVTTQQRRSAPIKKNQSEPAVVENVSVPNYVCEGIHIDKLFIKSLHKLDSKASYNKAE